MHWQHMRMISWCFSLTRLNHDLGGLEARKNVEKGRNEVV